MPQYPIIHRDYETRSECDLKKCGAHVYAAHPSTRIICAVWIIETSHNEFMPPVLWIGNMTNYNASAPMPAVIWDLIVEGEATVTGHNAPFEDAIDQYHAGPVLGWKVPYLEQLDCTMARAAVQSLPLDLDRLAIALGVREKKDREGGKLMRQMCKPRAARKGEDPHGVYWFYDQTRLERLLAYCIQDVRTEIAVDRALRPLQDQERLVWFLDQRMNNRGVQVDQRFVDLAELRVRAALDRANERMYAVTKGAVETVNQIEKLKNFASGFGVKFKIIEKTRRNGWKYKAEAADREALTDLLTAVMVEAEETESAPDDDDADPEIEAALAVVPGKSNAEWQPGDPPSVRAAFEVRLEAGKSSLKKLAKFRLQAPHGRARGTVQYHGAGPGRWAGRGIQMQNLVRKGIIEPGGWDQAYRDLRDLDDEDFELVWGSMFDVVSRMMRGALIAAPGKQLYYADYANVEARGCVWAARQNDMTKLFAADGLIYEEMGSSIFGLEVDEVARLHKTKQDIIPRFVGKETVLGCGYGMGWRAFQRNCKKKGGVILPDEICIKAIEGWRERNSKVVDFWRTLEYAAMRAVEEPGEVFSAGPFVYRVKGNWLQCRLPSGRLIWYRGPKIEATKQDIDDLPEWDWDADPAEQVPQYRWKIHYWGVNPVTKQWAREHTWGGKLLENCIQGMCADFLRCALLGLERAQYWPILSIHDEPISEVEQGFGSVEEFVSIVATVPQWAPGFPLKAEGGCGTRYVKG